MIEGNHASGAAGDSLWQACLEQLAQELPEQQFNTWIKPLTAQVTGDFSKVTVFVANRFKLDWIRAQYASRITQVLESLYGQQILLELALTPRETAARMTHLQLAREISAQAEPPDLGEESTPGPQKNR
ncbi:MAG TPA: DnaA N-terminal domain-containing protein, partial [Pseudorhodoferax sp.]|nr:DnaA N-terminal domain-containing protein [Pseudorhodoferax sp.]